MANFYPPNGNGAFKVPLKGETMEGKRFYVIGCLGGLDFSDFTPVGQAVHYPDPKICLGNVKSGFRPMLNMPAFMPTKDMLEKEVLIKNSTYDPITGHLL